MHETWPVWLLTGAAVAWHLGVMVLGGIVTWAALSGCYHVDRRRRRRARRDADAQRARAHEVEDALARAHNENAQLWRAFDETDADAARAALQRITTPEGGAS